MPYRIETVPTESDQPPEFFGEAFQPGDVVERFSHLVLETRDLGRSEAWYRDLIGLDVLGRDLTNEERPHSVLRMNTGQLLILVEQENVVIPRPGSVGLHHGFILTPSQMRRAMDRLHELGIELTCDREITRGDYSIELYDPDGHHVQIETLDPAQATEIVYPGVGVVDCGPADGYHIGDVKLFKDAEFFLVRVEEGFLALSRWCRHFNGRVIWRQEHWHFYCPYHHATYDRRGAPTILTKWSGRFRSLPALRLNPITFSPEGHVLVDTNRVVDRETYEPARASPVR